MRRHIPLGSRLAVAVIVALCFRFPLLSLTEHLRNLVLTSFSPTSLRKERRGKGFLCERLEIRAPSVTYDKDDVGQAVRVASASQTDCRQSTRCVCCYKFGCSPRLARQSAPPPPCQSRSFLRSSTEGLTPIPSFLNISTMPPIIEQVSRFTESCVLT